MVATVLPENADDKTVTFSTANKAIATVDASGKVTGVKAGTVKITATTSNGLKDECTVTVTNPVVKVTGVSIAPKTASVAVGSTTSLTATITPENATDKTVTFSSANDALATVNTNGVVTGVKATEPDTPVIITVTTNDGNKTDTCAVTVTAS